jgi:hypothetical protein
MEVNYVKQKQRLLRFEVFTVVLLRIQVFWNIKSH